MRRGNARARGKPESLVEQNLFERREEQKHVRFLARIAHQADAPHLALDRAQAAGNFDIEFVEQLAAHLSRLQFRRNVHGRDGNQAIGRILNEQFQAHRFESGDQGLLVARVALPARFEAFFQNGPQRFAHPIDQRNRRRVMIDALLAPVVHRRGQIEIPAAHRLFARMHHLFHARIHGDRRHARRRADRFLRTAEADVNALLVHIQRNSRQRRDRVDDQQRAQFIGDFAVVLDSLHDAGRSFSVRQADEFDLLALARAQDILRIDRAAVGRLDANHFRRNALGDDRHALGKCAVDADDALIARFERVHHRRFDAAGARCRNRKRDAILRLKDAAQQLLHVAHHLREPRVHVAHDRRGHRAIHARIHARGTRRQHQSLGRQNLANHSFPRSVIAFPRSPEPGSGRTSRVDESAARRAAELHRRLR